MTTTSRVTAHVAACVVAGFAVAISAGAVQQTGVAVRFSAIVLPSTAGAGTPTPIDITIERWSTQAEVDRVMTSLKELGGKGMLEALRQAPRVGSFAVPGATGYPLRYARSSRSPDGVERITLATDRYIGFGESSAGGRSLDYPITLIELLVKPNGQGEGTALPAAKVAFDLPTKSMIVENYGIQPVQLRAVRRVK